MLAINPGTRYPQRAGSALEKGKSYLFPAYAPQLYAHSQSFRYAPVYPGYREIAIAKVAKDRCDFPIRSADRKRWTDFSGDTALTALSVLRGRGQNGCGMQK